MQLQLFPKRIQDELGILGGITSARAIRADDGLNYVVKDEAAGVPSVRASEFFWLSLARTIGLTCATPEIIEDATHRKLVGTRREFGCVSDTMTALLTGNVHNAGYHLSKIYAYDLFSGNWDRHPGNYLVIDQGGVMVVFAIDFSHVVLQPTQSHPDPITEPNCATRVYIAPLLQPYAKDVPAAIEVLERIAAVGPNELGTILDAMPDDWCSPAEKANVLGWWTSADRANRQDAVKLGLQNGSL